MQDLREATVSARKIRPPVPAIALPPSEAAAALGIGETAFRSHVLPDVRVIRVNSIRLIPVAELERWADENAHRTLDQ
jgi:hypothetical protein